MFQFTVCPGGKKSLCLMPTVPKKKSTFILRCFEDVMLSWVGANLVSSAEMIAASSEVYPCTSNDGGNEVGFALGLFLEFEADGIPVYLLITAARAQISVQCSTC
jgi:hypothetical protein